MSKFWKIIICLYILFIGVMTFPVYASTTIYTVETNNGKQQVVIPEGMTEVDVLLRVSAAYYNLSAKYDELEAKSAELAAQVDEYVKANKELRNRYDELISDYTLLTKRYDTLNKLSWLQGSIGGFGVFGESGFKGAGIQLSGTFFKKINVFVQFQYPVAAAVGVGYSF